MDRSSWLESFRKLARQDSETLSLVADLRWTTEYANTDGFTQSVRLDARSGSARSDSLFLELIK